MEVPVIMSKSPQDFRLTIARVTTGDIWEVEEQANSVAITSNIITIKLAS